MRLAFTGDRNRPGKKDWSGAFLPEAKRFASADEDVVDEIPLTSAKGDERAQHRAHQRIVIASAIRELRPSVVGFFCHGLTREIELGFDRKTVGELAAALADVGCDRVALYCCSTGSGPGVGGEGGFADALRDAMCREGLVWCRVVASITAGHTTANPNKRFFEGRGSPVGGLGGVDIVRKGSALWKPWRRALRDPRDPLRFELADLDVGEIHRRLAA